MLPSKKKFCTGEEKEYNRSKLLPLKDVQGRKKERRLCFKGNPDNNNKVARLKMISLHEKEDAKDSRMKRGAACIYWRFILFQDKWRWSRDACSRVVFYSLQIAHLSRFSSLFKAVVTKVLA